ncbi:MAG: type II toxin-antitoxin system VapC family toxin [Actinobacteria bacterium]|nr:type II toxin-antitoxin system VapC family toxin [Actinomycetota bacterium]
MIVIDASVLANALGDDGAHGAAARAEISEAGQLVAPDLVDVETAAVLRKRWIAKHLSTERFEIAVNALIHIPVQRHPTAGLLLRVFELRDNITPYDAVYVALAEALSVDLVTGDKKLAAAPGPRCRIRVLT